MRTASHWWLSCVAFSLTTVISLQLYKQARPLILANNFKEYLPDASEIHTVIAKCKNVLLKVNASAGIWVPARFIVKVKNSTGSKATWSTSASSCTEPVWNDDTEMGPIGVTLKSESPLERKKKREHQSRLNCLYYGRKGENIAEDQHNNIIIPVTYCTGQSLKVSTRKQVKRVWVR